MKILVIYTGGTIGSVKSDGYVSISESTKGELIKRYKNSFGGDICFEEMSPFTILSENLSAEVLNRITAITIEKAKGDYDGIIITHGTDTVQYTACALSIALGECIPVLLVSSNYPLEDSRANGFDNFVGAVEFIKAKIGKGVFVSYKNQNETLKYHRGDRIMLHNSYTDALYSLLDKPYAEFSNGNVSVLNYDCPTSKGAGELHLSDDSSVLSIFAHPADSFSYGLDKVKAVIISAYHSGTLNTDNSCFRAFCKTAKDKGIPIYLYNIPYGNIYESAREFNALGLIRLPVCSYPYAFIHIWNDSKAFLLVEKSSNM